MLISWQFCIVLSAEVFHYIVVKWEDRYVLTVVVMVIQITVLSNLIYTLIAVIAWIRNKASRGILYPLQPETSFSRYITYRYFFIPYLVPLANQDVRCGKQGLRPHKRF